METAILILLLTRGLIWSQSLILVLLSKCVMHIYQSSFTFFFCCSPLQGDDGVPGIQGFPGGLGQPGSKGEKSVVLSVPSMIIIIMCIISDLHYV